MKKYYPVDFDEKGNAVLGNAKSNPTSNGFIPTTWEPGGSDAGNGIKSISISPSISTTPALESFFPIYLENLTEEEKQNGVVINVASTAEPSPGDYTLTVEPTGNWYAGIMGWDGDQQHVSENAGESVTASTSPAPITQFTVAGLRTPTPSGEDDIVFVNINLDNE